jgi:hypothetical protein
MATAVQVPSGIGNAEIGEAQRLFAEQAEAKCLEAIENRQSTPFTIINFNPVPLGLQGVLKQYKVWTPDDGKLPENVFRVELEYDGKTRRGHVLTIREPKKDGKMIGATGTGNAGEVIPQREPKLYMPREIAYSFMEHFSPVFTANPGTILPPAPKDARKIFGVLVFEGDIHTFENLMAEQDPDKQIINVPVCHISTVGKTSIKSFRTVDFRLDEYLRQMFAGQRKFADATVARAQQKWSETQTIADISDSDRVWYRWMIDLGYAQKPKPGEKTWLNEYLVLNEEEKPNANLRKCQACKAVEPEENTPFCPRCNAPVDIFHTFMILGKPVAEMWLQSLKGDERETVITEMRLRKQGFGEEPEAPKARGSYKGRGKLDPTQEIPAADSVTLPGEE